MCDCQQSAPGLAPQSLYGAYFGSFALGGGPTGTVPIYLPVTPDLWLPSHGLVGMGGLTVVSMPLLAAGLEDHKAATDKAETADKPDTPCESCEGAVCGPDVTKQIKDAVEKTKTTFKSWDDPGKKSACEGLVSLNTGLVAWDILELHNNLWILDYRTACATKGAKPPCGSTVQVGNQCYYAGSVNYVIWGVMCKLCSDFYGETKDAGGQSSFSESEMLNYVWKYKVMLPAMTLSGPAANLEIAKQWSVAGYNGWPSGATAPRGDRNGCKPVCPTPYSGPDFSIHWVGASDEVF